MGKFLTVCVLAGCVLASSAQAQTKRWDGPFGVQMGLSKEELNGSVPLAPQYGVPNEYVSKSAPRPNQGFVTYVYQIAPGAGLCRVRSETKFAQPRDTDRSFEALHARLSRKYGKPARQVANRSAIWENRSNMPKDVRTITLAVAKRVTAGTAVQLIFGFRNAASCDRPPVVDGKGL